MLSAPEFPILASSHRSSFVIFVIIFFSVLSFVIYFFLFSLYYRVYSYLLWSPVSVFALSLKSAMSPVCFFVVIFLLVSLISCFTSVCVLPLLGVQFYFLHRHFVSYPHLCSHLLPSASLSSVLSLLSQAWPLPRSPSCCVLFFFSYLFLLVSKFPHSLVCRFYSPKVLIMKFIYFSSAIKQYIFHFSTT